jgi:hypothetical protein
VAGPAALPLLRIAELRAQAPSAMLGIGCELCAWSFDSALLLRDRVREATALNRAEAEAEEERRAEAASARLQSAMRAGSFG